MATWDAEHDTARRNTAAIPPAAPSRCYIASLSSKSTIRTPQLYFLQIHLVLSVEVRGNNNHQLSLDLAKPCGTSSSLPPKPAVHPHSHPPPSSPVISAVFPSPLPAGMPALGPKSCSHLSTYLLPSPRAMCGLPVNEIKEPNGLKSNYLF